MPVQDPVPLDALLAQAGWAKALARQLARDDDAADELVQRTWVAALEHPPRIPGGGASTLRRWMASVMRNFVRQDARERDRRQERESRVAKPERVNDSAREGLEGQRRLLEALHGLAEPYRAALYARYFEGLSPRRIARRDGVPVATVKSRLARGLSLLRERLDRAHGGDRSAWMVWLFPLTAKSATPTALLGAFIVDTKLKVAGVLAALVCVLAIGVQALREPGARPDESRALAADTPVMRPADSAPAPSSDAPAPERVNVAGPAPVAAPPTRTTPEVARDVVHGRVLDLENRPVAGVHVVREKAERGSFDPKLEPVDIRSDDSGHFDLPPERLAYHALVDDPRWITVYKAYVHASLTREVTVFVAPRFEISGRVVDPGNHPVEGAEVTVQLDESVKRNLQRRLDGTYRENYGAKTDVGGRFELSLPACKGVLTASAPGWKPGTAPMPAFSSSDVEIVLSARDKLPAVVRGIVVDEAHAPIAGAFIGIGSMTQATGADGRFAFDLDTLSEDEPMVSDGGSWRPQYDRTCVRAVKAGKLPREEKLPPVEELRAANPPCELTLVLEGSTLEIRGRVVDADGKPIRGVQLRVLDPTKFGPIYRRSGEAAAAMEASVEELARGGLGFVDGDSTSNGAFTITGLTARSYDLGALDPATLRYLVVSKVPAGTSDLRIVLPSSSSLAHVAGRVVSHAGEGLASLDLHLGRMFPGAPGREFARTLRTDADGRFDLGSIVPDSFCIQVTGEEIFLLLAWQPPAGAELDRLEITVSRRCPVKVELTPAAPRADAFSFLDQAGRPTENLCFEGPMMSLPLRCPIVGAVSEAYATEDTARTLVLYDHETEVGRIPVQLVPGTLTILRP